MGWLARVFAAAIVRRLAYVIVAIILAALSMSRAEAKDYPDQGSAWAGCNATASQAAAGDKGNKATGKTRCDHIPGRYTCTYEVKPYENGAPAYIVCVNFQNLDTYHTYPADQSCEAKGGYTGSGPWSSDRSARSGSIGCRNGCDGAWFSNSDGSKTWAPTGDSCPDDEKERCKQFPDHFWNAILNVCEPPEGECPGGGKTNSLGQCAPEPCPAGKVQQADGTCKNKENECPAGQIKSPDGKCLPGDGQCAEGEVRGKDGTCKKDSDGDGEPDPGEEGEGPNGETADAFSGGDSCNEPPSCSGSPIMCGQARIQWRIDCNTRKNRNIAGGTCSAMPICTGEKCDALEYTGLLMQWRTACALEKMNTGSGTGSNPDLVAIRNALTGTGGTVDPGTSLPGSGAWQTGNGGQPTQPDTSGYGWGGGSCPAIPAIDVMGATIQFDPAPLCNWLSLGSYFVMGLAALASLRIVATKDA